MDKLYLESPCSCSAKGPTIILYICHATFAMFFVHVIEIEQCTKGSKCSKHATHTFINELGLAEDSYDKLYQLLTLV